MMATQPLFREPVISRNSLVAGPDNWANVKGCSFIVRSMCFIRDSVKRNLSYRDCVGIRLSRDYIPFSPLTTSKSCKSKTAFFTGQ